MIRHCDLEAGHCDLEILEPDVILAAALGLIRCLRFSTFGKSNGPKKEFHLASRTGLELACIFLRSFRSDLSYILRDCGLVIHSILILKKLTTESLLMFFALAN